MSHSDFLSLVSELDGLLDRQKDVWSRLRTYLADCPGNDSNQLKFDRARRVISWHGGKISFIRRAERRFLILRALWKTPRKRMLEYKIAEKFFMDDETSSATIKTALRRIARDLRAAGCPYALRYNVKGAWLELK